MKKFDMFSKMLITLLVATMLAVACGKTGTGNNDYTTEMFKTITVANAVYENSVHTAKELKANGTMGEEKYQKVMTVAEGMYKALKSASISLVAYKMAIDSKKGGDLELKDLQSAMASLAGYSKEILELVER